MGWQPEELAVYMDGFHIICSLENKIYCGHLHLNWKCYGPVDVKVRFKFISTKTINLDSLFIR